MIALFSFHGYDSNMRFLVTGGAGFIGSTFCQDLASNLFSDLGLCASEITVLDSLTYAGNLTNLTELQQNSNFRFVKGSILDTKIVEDLMAHSDYLVNFAAESHVDNSILDGSNFVSSNVLGVVNLLETLKKFPRVKMIQVSTDEVYGSINSGSWHEESPVEPNSPYSASKASADLFTRAYAKTHGINVLTTRCSNNYGPHQHAEKLIPTLISKLLRDEPLPIYGDGRNIREWIHVQDHCRGIAFVAAFGHSGEVYNIGTADEFSNLEIAKMLLNLSNSNSDLNFVADRLGHDFRYSLNTQKIRSMGWSPNVEFNSGLAETFEWYKTRANWNT